MFLPKERWLPVGAGKGEGQERGRKLRGTTTMYIINKLEGYIRQYGDVANIYNNYN